MKGCWCERHEALSCVFEQNSLSIMRNAAFRLGLYCLPKYPFRGFQYTRGKTPLQNFVMAI